MKVKEARPGGLCRSVRGRDEGKTYVILGTDGGLLRLSDGRTRKVGNPKRKNPKHVELLPCFLEGDLEGKGADERIAERLRSFRNGTEDVKGV